MTTLTEAPFVITQGIEPGEDDTLTHTICGDCDDELAFCGLDVSGWEVAEDDEDDNCLVCAELSKLPCPRCGSLP